MSISLDQASESFPEFEVEKTLGDGGQKSVFVVRDEAIGRTALKIVEVAAVDDEDSGFWTETAAIRLTREIETMLRLDSPFVGRVLTLPEARAIGGTSCLWYREELYGKNVRELVNANGIDPNSAADAISCTLSAVEALSSTGCVHRDIKPENVLRKETDGSFVLVDFGLVLDLELPRITGAEFPGTTVYAPLEQFQTERRVDVRTDIFGVGQVGFWALTGTNPFVRHRMTIEDYVAALRAGPPQDLRGAVDDCIAEFIERCLATYRHQRYRSAAAARTAWARCIEGGLG